MIAGVLLLVAQSTAPPASYRQRIDAYRSGTMVTDADLALPVIGPESTAAWTPVDLQAAAMLHTDVCLRLVKIGRAGDAGRHLQAASTLLRAAVAEDAAVVDYARRWRETVSGLLDAFNARDLARDLDRGGREWWPESRQTEAARKAFGDGLGHEIAAAVAGRLSGPAPTRAVMIAPEAVVPLHQADTDYGRALALDPGLVEAALHRGRVSMLLWHDADAAALLRPAAAAVNPSVRYLALMFAGALDERAGRVDAAIEQYRRARETFRWAQSAPLALSHALMRAGRDAEARDALTAFFTGTRGRICDPLWTYLADPSTDLGPTLDELRAEVWR